MSRKRVVVVGQSPLFSQELARMISEWEFQIVQELDSLFSAQSGDMIRPAPDVTLLSTSEPDEDTYGAVAAWRAAFPDARIGVLAASYTRASIASLLEAGADGCVMRHIPPDALRRCLDRIMIGDKVIPAQFARKSLN